MVFVDGVGVGADEPAHNPLARASLPHLTALAGRRPVHLHGDGSPGARPGSSGKDGSDGETAPRASAWHPLDARLGLPGLPQSGTGQTSLLTGVNAAALLGEHHGPYPGPRLRPLLETQSLWRSLSARDLPVAFANAFPERYLARVGPERGRMGAFARSALLAGVRLRGPDDLRAGRGLSAFLDNRGWREQLGYADIPRIDEAEAGRRLADLARGHALTIFEHYATDIAGHHPERLDPVAVLEALDRFLGGVLEGWADDDLLIVCSDHGNLEDARVRRHTRNPALGIWRGPAADRPLRSLTDLAPAILNMLDAGSRESGPDHNPRTRYP